MSSYLLMLYVTLEQETAIRDLFQKHGWTYDKQHEGNLTTTSTVSDLLTPGSRDTELYNSSAALNNSWIFLDISPKNVISTDSTNSQVLSDPLVQRAGNSEPQNKNIGDINEPKTLNNNCIVHDISHKKVNKKHSLLRKTKSLPGISTISSDHNTSKGGRPSRNKDAKTTGYVSHTEQGSSIVTNTDHSEKNRLNGQISQTNLSSTSPTTVYLILTSTGLMLSLTPDGRGKTGSSTSTNSSGQNYAAPPSSGNFGCQAQIASTAVQHAKVSVRGPVSTAWNFNSQTDIQPSGVQTKTAVQVSAPTAGMFNTQSCMLSTTGQKTALEQIQRNSSTTATPLLGGFQSVGVSTVVHGLSSHLNGITNSSSKNRKGLGQTGHCVHQTATRLSPNHNTGSHSLHSVESYAKGTKSENVSASDSYVGHAHTVSEKNNDCKRNETGTIGKMVMNVLMSTPVVMSTMSSVKVDGALSQVETVNKAEPKVPEFEQALCGPSGDDLSSDKDRAVVSSATSDVHINVTGPITSGISRVHVNAASPFSEAHKICAQKVNPFSEENLREKLLISEYMRQRKSNHKCSICGKTFLTSDKLYQHKSDVHVPRVEQSSVCQVCSKDCIHPILLRAHMFKHPVKRFLCDYCYFSSHDKSEVGTHEQNEHAQLGESFKLSHKCSACHERFVTSDSLHQHISDVHMEQSSICQVCSKDCRRPNCLAAHMFKHNVKHVKRTVDEFSSIDKSVMHSFKQKELSLFTQEYRCHICGKKLMSNTTLKLHLQLHEGKHPYGGSSNPDIKALCEICGKSFCRVNTFNEHMLVHNNVRNFKCNVCKAAFKKKPGWTRHMVSHMGDRRYTCSVCDKKFLCSDTLKRHTLIHTGEKPWHCHICGKRFNQKMTLTGHMTTHTGMKPFSCEVCGASFSQRGSRRAHKRKEHAM